MYDLGIIALVGITAFVMLIRGDPKRTLPASIGAVALFLVPAVTMLTIAYFTPKGELPSLFKTVQGEFFLYPLPDALNLQKALERNYKAIHETFETLLTAQQASLTALFAVAFIETLPEVVSARCAEPSRRPRGAWRAVGRGCGCIPGRGLKCLGLYSSRITAPGKNPLFFPTCECQKSSTCQ
jgi:hypothetical protein